MADAFRAAGGHGGAPHDRSDQSDPARRRPPDGLFHRCSEKVMRTLSARARAANASDPSAQLGSELDQHRVATRNLYMARIHTITVVYGTVCATRHHIPSHTRRTHAPAPLLTRPRSSLTRRRSLWPATRAEHPLCSGETPAQSGETPALFALGELLQLAVSLLAADQLILPVRQGKGAVSHNACADKQRQ